MRLPTAWRRRPRTVPPTCGWMHATTDRTLAVTLVDIGRDCGHTQDLRVPTCTAHLNHLVSTSGVAARIVPCRACGKLLPARVTATHDLPA